MISPQSTTELLRAWETNQHASLELADLIKEIGDHQEGGETATRDQQSDLLGKLDKARRTMTAAASLIDPAKTELARKLQT